MVVICSPSSFSFLFFYAVDFVVFDFFLALPSRGDCMFRFVFFALHQPAPVEGYTDSQPSC